MGVSLVSVRGENSSGLQQLQNGLGELDEKRWMEHVQRRLTYLVMGSITVRLTTSLTG